MEHNFWRTAHAGDVVIGGDGQTWGVVAYSVTDGDMLSVTLYRLGTTVTGTVSAGAPVVFVQRADVRAEAAAWAVLSAAGLGPLQIIGESL